MVYSSKNLVTGRQLRAARTLAGMTQRDLARVLGVNERAVRFWERKHDRRPTSAPNDARIEQSAACEAQLCFGLSLNTFNRSSQSRQYSRNPARPCAHLMELNRRLGIVSWAA